MKPNPYPTTINPNASFYMGGKTVNPVTDDGNDTCISCADIYGTCDCHTNGACECGKTEWLGISNFPHWYCTRKVQAEAVNEGIKLTLAHKDSIHPSERLDPQTKVMVVRLADHVTEDKFLDTCRKTKADLEDLSREWAKVDAGREKLKARSKVLLKKLGW
jgi:hypothetical protein|tara:strand:- start:816 stop:1298 length:483 start_codon:yes stop_codon:yes gene_type:complete